MKSKAVADVKVTKDKQTAEKAPVPQTISALKGKLETIEEEGAVSGRSPSPGQRLG